MAHFPKLLIGTTLAVFLAGCSSDQKPSLNLTRTPTKSAPRPKPDILKLTDHLIGVATLSDRDAILAEQCLDKNKISYGTFVDVSSVGIVVKEENAERARRLIREDSWNRGYKLLERIAPIPEPDRVALHGPLTEPKPKAAIEPAPPKVTTDAKMVTVTSVAPKDVKTVLACLTENGFKAPGTWQSKDAYGIVVPAEIAPKVLALLQEDAKKHNYRLLSPSVREPIAEQNEDFAAQTTSKEDLSARASLIVFVREQDESFVSECLEAHNISSAASFDLGSSAVYVSEYDAERALALIQENSRTKGYAFTTKRFRS